MRALSRGLLSSFYCTEKINIEEFTISYISKGGVEVACIAVLLD